MAKIQVIKGKWGDETTTQLNLTNAHVVNPEAGYDKIIMYTEKRNLMTFLTAGATNGAFTVARTTESYKTRIPLIPTGEMIAGNAWKHDTMGRIQIASTILGTGAVGVPTSGSTKKGGYFNLLLKDNYLAPGMNVIFYNGKIARTMAHPSGGPNGYTYRFQCYPGDTFSWDTWVAPQLGQKTCFGGYTTYGERSLKGYGRVHYPDKYINHMTIQRKGASITGDANVEEVLWYVTKTKEGNSAKGWIFWIEAQIRAQLTMEDEYQKKFGESTMRDSLGNLLDTPSMIDEESGLPIIAGDGAITQIKGVNDMDATGVNGEAVWDDFADMLSELKKRSNSDNGRLFYCITGTDGRQNVHTQALLYGHTNYQLTQMITQDDKIGGADPAIGFNFQKLNINGDTVVFVVDAMLDDPKRFPRRLTNGKLASAMTYYFLDWSPDDTGRPNIEIRTKGRKFINRNFVYYYQNGMTGDGMPQSAIDGKEFQILKQNLIAVFNVLSCGIISPPATM